MKGRFVVPMVGLSFSTDRKPLVRLAFFEAQAVVALQIAIGLVYARLFKELRIRNSIIRQYGKAMSRYFVNGAAHMRLTPN